MAAASASLPVLKRPTHSFPLPPSLNALRLITRSWILNHNGISTVHSFPVMIHHLISLYFQIPSGTLYSIGFNQFNLSGHPCTHHRDRHARLTRVTWTSHLNTHISSIAHSSVHLSAFLASNGCVYICDRNNSRPFLLEINSLTGGPPDSLIKKPVQIVSLNSGNGYPFIVMIDTHGHVHSMGMNLFGQRGFALKINSNTSHLYYSVTPYTHLNLLKIKENDQVIDVSAGMWHCVFLTRKGNVYSCGNNYYKQVRIYTYLYVSL